MENYKSLVEDIILERELIEAELKQPYKTNELDEDEIVFQCYGEFQQALACGIVNIEMTSNPARNQKSCRVQS